MGDRAVKTAVQCRIDLVLEHVRRVEAGAHCPDPQECADLVVALTDVRVRDVVLGIGDHVGCGTC